MCFRSFGYIVRPHSLKDHLWWKTTFDGRGPLEEDNRLWETKFDVRQSLMDDNF